MSALEMTQAEYARHRGVSRQAIGKLIDAGKIPYREDGGKKIIDAAAADRALGETRERVNTSDEDGRGSGGGFAGAETGGKLTQAKTATEIYRARLAQLDYDERVGKLVATADVMTAMQKCAGAIVRDLDQLPSYAEELATVFQKDGVAGVRNKLKEIVRNTRIVLAQSMTLLAEEQKQPEQGSQ